MRGENGEKRYEMGKAEGYGTRLCVRWGEAWVKH